MRTSIRNHKSTIGSIQPTAILFIWAYFSVLSGFAVYTRSLFDKFIMSEAENVEVSVGNVEGVVKEKETREKLSEDMKVWLALLFVSLSLLFYKSSLFALCLQQGLNIILFANF